MAPRTAKQAQIGRLPADDERLTEVRRLQWTHTTPHSLRWGQHNDEDGDLLVVAEQPRTLPTLHADVRMRRPERRRRSYYWPIVTIVSLLMIVVVSPLAALGFYEYEQTD